MVTTSTFGDALISARDAQLDHFGVDATYQPGVLDREITAIVRYTEDAGQVGPVSRHKSPIVNIKVANDSTEGISASEFLADQTSKTISVPPRRGADARTFTLARILIQNDAFVTFEAH